MISWLSSWFGGGSIRAEEDTRRGPGDDFWYHPVGAGGPAKSGVDVTPDTAMQASAVYACVRVIAETLAQIPLHEYRRLARGKEKARDQNLYRVLHDRPNTWQTSFEYREMCFGHVSLRGNMYSLIQPGELGAVTNLIPLHPDKVTPRWLNVVGGPIAYEYRGGGQTQYFTQAEIFHVRGLSADGLVGLSPISLAKEAIGLALVAEEHGARTFANGAKPGGILEHPGRLNPKAAENLRASFHSVHGGAANTGKTAVLEEGMKYHELGMTSSDAQFLETRKFQTTEIARIFRVPPHMIGDLDRATFSNIEQQGIDFTTYTIAPWASRFEQAANRDLVSDPETYFVEFDLDGLQRGDISTRYNTYSIGKQQGFLNTNEIREKENLNPIEGGDKYLDPMNMTPADGSPPPGQSPDGNTDAAGGPGPGVLLLDQTRLDQPPLRLQETPPTPASAAATAADGGEISPAESRLAESRPAGGSHLEETPPAASSAEMEFSEIAARMVLIMAHDVSQRVARVEIAQLEKRADKAAADRPRFDAWVSEFLEGHAGYVAKAFEPMFEAVALMGVVSPDPEAAALFAAGVVAETAAELAGDPVEVLARWRQDNGRQLVYGVIDYLKVMAINAYVGGGTKVSTLETFRRLQPKSAP